ncbi:hypothetical protein N1851_004926 [Merluccius polli]|uniref:Uncharacterized protein n=1 Tax=Merluccius polli TaxID=89951 RepID=A0AA47N6Q8_MERPO|nr:hypothetical protein N1851_004926 [Merluccius polli]
MWKLRMEEAYQLATKTAQASGKRGKEFYDKKIQGAELHPGNRVLIRNLTERGGPGKLRSFWEEKVHVVVKRKHHESPVYEVQPEDGQGRTRVLHRNLLLPCDFLPVETHTPEKKRGKRGCKDKKRTQTPRHTEPESSSDSEEDDWRCIAGWPKEGSLEQHRTSLRPEASEFQPHQPTEAPAPEEDDGMAGPPEALWPLGADEEPAVTDLEDDETATVDPEEEEAVSPPSSPPARQYPSRFRHAPRTLTYNTLGQPTFS